MSKPLPFPWTDAEVADLVRMRGEGASINAIAEHLGCTRNAVAGKLRRLGLSEPRRSPIKPLPDWARAKIARMLSAGSSVRAIARAMRISNTGVLSVEREMKARRIVVRAAPMPIAPVEDADVLFASSAPRRLDGATGPGPGIGMSDLLRSQCAWPLWGNKDRPSFRCCGAPVEPGRPYCSGHSAVAYKADIPAEQSAA